MASAGTAYVDVEARLDDFASQVESEVSSISAQPVDVEVGAVTSEAEAAIDGLDGGTTEVDVGASTSEAEGAIDALDGGETTVEVSANTDQAQSQIGSLGGAMESLTGAAEGGSGALDAFAGAALGAGSVSSMVASGGMAALAAGAGASVSALMEIEVVGAKLNQVLETTGAGAYITAGEIDTLAASMEAQTGQSAESITTSATLLATFSGLSSEAAITSGVFERSITATADIAALMGGSAADAALRLGRALDNPVSGMTALQRSGVSFTESQKATITALAESGDMLGAQAELLSVVESQVGGVAAAYGDTLAGSIDKAKHAMGELGESIVSPTIPVLDQLVGAVGRAAGTFNDFFGSARDDAFSGWWEDTFGGGADGAKAYGDAVGYAKTETDGFTGAADAAADALGRVNERLQSYLDGQFEVPVAERALRASFESLTASLDAPARSADDVAAGLQGIVERTVDLGIASGNMPSAVNAAVYGLAALQAQGKLSAEDVALVTSQLNAIPGSTEAQVSTPGAVEAKNQADAVGDAIRGVPPDKESTITLYASKALGDAANFKRILDTIDKNPVVTLQFKQVGDPIPKGGYAGGTESAAPGMAWVGEEGPELVSFNGGEKVFTAGQSKSMTSSGVGMVNHITVNAPGANGPELARIITDELRKLERAGR